MSNEISEDKAIQKVEQECSPVLMKASALEIKTEEDVKMSEGFRKSIRELKRNVGDTLDPFVQAAHENHKKAVANRQAYIDPLDKADRLLKKKEADYYNEVARQAEIARKEQERLAEEERKKIEAKIGRLLKGIDDIQKQIDALEAEMVKEETTDQEADQIRSQLNLLHSKLEKKSETLETMEQEIEEASMVPDAHMVAPQVKGSMVREPEVINKIALLKAAAEGLVPENIFDINNGQLKKYVNMGDNIRPAGVRITTRRVVR